MQVTHKYKYRSTALDVFTDYWRQQQSHSKYVQKPINHLIENQVWVLLHCRKWSLCAGVFGHALDNLCIIMTSMYPKNYSHALEYTKFPLSKCLELVYGNHTVSPPQADPLLWFSIGSILNWFHMRQLWIVFLECSSMASVQMTSSDNAGFVPGLFSWLLVFQCSCFDKQYRNAFFPSPQRMMGISVFWRVWSPLPLQPSSKGHKRIKILPLSPADAPC